MIAKKRNDIWKKREKKLCFKIKKSKS